MRIDEGENLKSSFLYWQFCLSKEVQHLDNHVPVHIFDVLVLVNGILRRLEGLVSVG